MKRKIIISLVLFGVIAIVGCQDKQLAVDESKNEIKVGQRVLPNPEILKEQLTKEWEVREKVEFDKNEIFKRKFKIEYPVSWQVKRDVPGLNAVIFSKGDKKETIMGGSALIVFMEEEKFKKNELIEPKIEEVVNWTGQKFKLKFFDVNETEKLIEIEADFLTWPIVYTYDVTVNPAGEFEVKKFVEQIIVEK